MRKRKIHLLLIGFLFWMVMPSSQAQYSVQFKLIDCRDKSDQPYMGIDTLIVYKADGLKIAGFLLPVDWNHTDTVVLSEKGIYHVVYANVFGQTVDKKVNIQEKASVVINLCTDSLVSYDNNEILGVNRLHNLSDGESIIISFERRGCFEFRTEQIKITLKNGKYIAQQYSMRRKQKKNRQIGGWRWKYKRDGLIAQTVLTKQQQADFLRFENELQQITLIGCTTSDHYNITSASGLSIDRVDGSCEWNGYDFLEASFFPETQMD
mgnify:CR=1 FL=1